MTINATQFIDDITTDVAKHFHSLGGERPANSLMAAAFEGKPAAFALGVDIKDVVTHVIRKYDEALLDRFNKLEAKVATLKLRYLVRTDVDGPKQVTKHIGNIDGDEKDATELLHFLASRELVKRSCFKDELQANELGGYDIVRKGTTVVRFTQH